MHSARRPLGVAPRNAKQAATWQSAKTHTQIGWAQVSAGRPLGGAPRLFLALSRGGSRGAHSPPAPGRPASACPTGWPPCTAAPQPHSSACLPPGPPAGRPKSAPIWQDLPPQSGPPAAVLEFKLKFNFEWPGRAPEAGDEWAAKKAWGLVGSAVQCIQYVVPSWNTLSQAARTLHCRACTAVCSTHRSL